MRQLQTPETVDDAGILISLGNTLHILSIYIHTHMCDKSEPLSKLNNSELTENIEEFDVFTY